ncbi:Pre-rRNA-processing protein TSR1-like [Glycine soja]|uniref:Pre-rRNA-processing protein TSR1-like n=1 Tax=Glycine soja TaxID=3848 RepID=A0A445HP91_GLYSO|nr:Pre-rRNA-processing protein TSR1-like [Glycine soja]
MNGPTMIPSGEELEKSDVGVDMLKFLVDLFHKCVEKNPSKYVFSSIIVRGPTMIPFEVDNLTRKKIEDELNELKQAHAAYEVDTPLDVPARKRFAKYRGLKSFRTSSWDPKESLPQDYARIFEFDNFKRTQKHVLAKALELDHENREDCIPVGSYARLHVMGVPSVIASKLSLLTKTIPVTACGLLKHESKVSVLHCKPIFSSEFINTDKNKMERFLHAGHFSVASIYAQISFPPLPTIILKRDGDNAAPAMAAVGSLKTIDNP